MIDVKCIREQVNKMREDVLNGNLDTEMLKEKYSYLFNTTPSIWFMIKDNGDNEVNEVNESNDYMPLLDVLLGKAEDFHGSKSEDKESELETKHHEVNEILAEAYVYPVVGKLNK